MNKSVGSIWWFAFGYFACYVPYSAMTKAVSKGIWPGMEKGVDGSALLPLSVAASTIGMLAFISAMGWWRFVPRRRVLGMTVLVPGIWQFMSGLCTATIIMTTTLAYTFDGVSIVFVMLLMRGGVLAIAPVVDRISGRRTHWYSWAGLWLSLAALVVAFAEEADVDSGGAYRISALCALDVTAYMLAYFLRFRFMSRLAKSDDPDVTKGYFAREQMVAAPVLLLALAAVALAGGSKIALSLRTGFLEVPFLPIAWVVVAIGVLSQGTGIFGTLVFLDARENTFCVPVNRCSSILAGVVAAFSLKLFFDQRSPSTHELAGAALVVVAILFLSLPGLLAGRRPVAASAPGQR